VGSKQATRRKKEIRDEHISTPVEDKKGGKEGRANDVCMNKRGRLSLIKENMKRA
jgi:hypothetical protein